VVKNSRRPGRNCVAARARRRSCRESGRDVNRYRASNRCGAKECRLVAPITIRRTERVVVVYMAGRAGSRRRRHVRPCQRKPSDAVVERRRGPPRGCMASGAVRRGKCRS
jgi:hypothetical protein